MHKGTVPYELWNFLKISNGLGPLLLSYASGAILAHHSLPPELMNLG
jgi:hypothetical protein